MKERHQWRISSNSCPTDRIDDIFLEHDEGKLRKKTFFFSNRSKAKSRFELGWKTGRKIIAASKTKKNIDDPAAGWSIEEMIVLFLPVRWAMRTRLTNQNVRLSFENLFDEEEEKKRFFVSQWRKNYRHYSNVLVRPNRSFAEKPDDLSTENEQTTIVLFSTFNEEKSSIYLIPNLNSTTILSNVNRCVTLVFSIDKRCDTGAFGNEQRVSNLRR